MTAKEMFLVGLGLSYIVLCIFFIRTEQDENIDRDQEVANFVHEQILIQLPKIAETKFENDSVRIQETGDMILLSSYFKTQNEYGQNVTMTYSALIQQTKGGWSLLILKLNNKLVQLGTHYPEE